MFSQVQEDEFVSWFLDFNVPVNRTVSPQDDLEDEDLRVLNDV